MYVLGSNSPRGHIAVDVTGIGLMSCRSLVDLSRPERLGGRTALVVHWPAGSSAPRLLAALPGQSQASVVEEVPFARLWELVAEHLAAGYPANEFEVLVTNRPLPPMDAAVLGDLAAPTTVDIAVGYRAGVYVLPRALLQDLEATRNNRGILIPRQTVMRLLATAREAGYFVPFALWYAAYSQDRPPDLYSSQRGEYDSLFSARGRDLL